MGFMDKAKKMAEQAQAKLDEAQQQFNDMQSGGAPQQQQGPVVQYDKHGRPIGDAPVAPGTGEPPAPAGPTVGAPVPGAEAAAPPPPPAPPVAPPPAPPAASAPAPPPAPAPDVPPVAQYDQQGHPVGDPPVAPTAPPAPPAPEAPTVGAPTPPSASSADRPDDAPPPMTSGDPLFG